MKFAFCVSSVAWLAMTRALQLCDVPKNGPSNPVPSKPVPPKRAPSKPVPSKPVPPRVQEDSDGWQFINLDKNEVANRGSYCMDGSAPGYWYKEGTEEGKWTVAFEGGEMYCYDDSSCLEMMQRFQKNPDSKVSLNLYESGDFANYNHIQLSKCDGGIYMSDSTLTVGGQTMYLRGKRILDHTFENLQGNTTFGSATEVMLTGGSGGGHAAVLVADYVKTLMPTSVKKYGAVPMSGWYATSVDKIDKVFEIHQMQDVVAPGCAAALSSEQHKCLQPENSYKYSETPMFVVQMLDSQSLEGYCGENSTLCDATKDAWTNCLNTKSPHCDTDQAALLENYLEDFVSSIKSIPKYSQKGEGGFLSTCTKHVFFKVDEYNNYANNGVIVEDAISNWWKNLGSSAAKWYLPCELNVNQPNSLQCEDSCSYDSGQTD